MTDYVCPCCKSPTNGGDRLDPCHCDYGDCPNCNPAKEN